MKKPHYERRPRGEAKRGLRDAFGITAVALGPVALITWGIDAHAKSEGDNAFPRSLQPSHVYSCIGVERVDVAGTVAMLKPELVQTATGDPADVRNIATFVTSLSDRGKQRGVDGIVDPGDGGVMVRVPQLGTGVVEHIVVVVIGQGAGEPPQKAECPRFFMGTPSSSD
jgi:hypothetical protein